MIGNLAAKTLISGMVALTVISSTPVIASATTSTTIPSTVTTPETKQATVIWKNLNTTIHKISSNTGFSGQVVYTASGGATGNVFLRVLRFRPGSITGTEIARASLDASNTNYIFNVTDINHGLSSGAVKYRVEATVSATGTKVALPADISVNYNKTASSIASNKLAGRTLVTDSLYPFNVTGKISGSMARVVYVQRYDARRKTWNNINSVYAYPAKTFYMSLPATKVTETYRTYTPATLTYAAHYGPATAVKRTSPRGQFYSQLVTKKRIVPWEANTANIYVASRLVRGEATPLVTLQAIVNGRWKNITSIRKQGRINFTLPKGTTKSANVKHTYRYVVGASRFSDSAISAAFTVQWENPYLYTGLKRTAYNHTVRHCPNVLIDMKALSGNTAGIAYMGSDITALSPRVPAHHLRTVVLHECAHHWQWKLQKADWYGFKNKMDRLYYTSGNRGMEHNADCIANIWAKNTYWGYGRTCSGAQLTAAKIMASGRRY